MPAVTREGRRLQILGISLALLNAVLWFCTPAICAFVDDITGRRTDPHNPLFISGVQELFVYFDPWLAHGVFPFIYTLGLAAIPFLKKPSEIQTAPPGGRAYSIVVSLLLIAFEMVWLFLITVQVFLRGPNWNIFWPGEPWDVHRVVMLNNVNFSQYFWVGRPVPGTTWVLRELPGLVLLAGYFLAGSAIAYRLFRLAHRQTPYWRWLALVVLVQFAALLPIKMVARWSFNLKYLIYIPEHFWNI